MSNYGVNVYDSAGQLGTQTTSVLGRVLFAGEVAFGAQYAVTVSGCDFTRPFFVGFQNPFYGFFGTFNSAKANQTTGQYTLENLYYTPPLIGFGLFMQW